MKSPQEREVLMLGHERKLWEQGAWYIAGIDEAGRGPLAGPVVAAAVVVRPGFFIPEVDDSKRLTAVQRESLFDRILKGAAAVGIGRVDQDVIDEVNILNATLKAMGEAVRMLTVRPDHLLVDGNRFMGIDLPYTTVIGGDAVSFSIAAASIIAKVTRDRIMTQFDGLFPGYGFSRHKGYGTKEHREAIAQLGFCPIHRRSFSLKRPIALPV